MEHILLPSDSRYEHPNIPLYSKHSIDFASQDRQLWSEYDDHAGWTWDGRVSALRSCTELNAELYDLVGFLQEWLFFGNLGVLLGSFYERERFLADGDFVTTHDLIPQLQQWAASTHLGHSHLSTESGLDKLLADMIFNLEDMWTWLFGLERFAAARTVTEFADLLLSIECLCKTLEHTVLTMQAVRKRARSNAIVAEEKRRPWNIQTRSWPANATVVKRMADANWCPSTVKRLGDLIGGTSLYYLSCLSRNGRIVTHELCDNSQCVTRRLDKENYRPRHVTHECQCPLIGPSLDQMCHVLEGKGIPLIRIHGTDVSTIKVQLTGSIQDSAYIAISHVISDGWGNFKDNNMPSCQLLRIQKLVTALQQGYAHEPAPFWIDTINVPLADKALKHHLIAMERMVQTYSCASKVLVLDDELLHTTSLLPKEEMMLRIASSEWMSRLWTLQEGVLTPRTGLYIQLADRTMPINSTFTEWATDDDPFNNLAVKVLCWPALMQLHNIVGLADSAVGMPQRFDVLMLLLRGRGTSIQGDVPYVFANLTGITPAPMLRLPREHDVRQRSLATMATAWPQCILFYSGSRLSEQGYRWFLKSFIQSGNPKGSLGSLRGEPSFADNFQCVLGKVLTQGLLVSYPGYVLDPADVTKSASLELHIPEEDAYFNAGALYIDDAFATSRYKDIAPGPGKRMGIVRRDLQPRIGANNPAILVTIVDEDDETVYCRYEWRLGLEFYTDEKRGKIAAVFDEHDSDGIARVPHLAIAHCSSKRWCIG